MLGVGITDKATHEESMELNNQAFKLIEEATIRSENLTAGFGSEQCSLPGCIPCMSAFGHCMSERDSMKMWALQVATTNDKEEWCEQVNSQELELHVAIVYNKEAQAETNNTG